jgi:hypothetical protein
VPWDEGKSLPNFNKNKQNSQLQQNYNTQQNYYNPQNQNTKPK